MKSSLFDQLFQQVLRHGPGEFGDRIGSRNFILIDLLQEIELAPRAVDGVALNFDEVVDLFEIRDRLLVVSSLVAGGALGIEEVFELLIPVPNGRFGNPGDGMHLTDGKQFGFGESPSSCHGFTLL